MIIPSITIANEYTIDDNSNLQYFGYIGYKSLISDNNIDSTYNSSSKPELGLNIIYNNNNFQIFNQFRYGEESGTYLAYNFMQYSFHLTEETNITFKGGKLRHELGLYNSTRVNPTTRQGVIQPQAIYWDSLDEFMTSGTGVGAVLKSFDFELGFTIDDPTMIDPDKIRRVMVGPILNDIKETSFGDHYIAYISYTPRSIPLIVKTSYSSLNLGSDYSNFGNFLLPKHVTSESFNVSAITVGAEYDFDKFIISGETLWFRTPDKEWSDTQKLTKGFSVSGTYHINDNYDLRLNYNEYDSSLGKKFFPTTPWLAYQKDLNTGINYHNGNWMFNIEAHYINGSKNLDIKDVSNNVNDYKQWWMVGTNIIYSF